MKKSVYLSVLVLSAMMFIFSGCKRGEEDPFLTFHTRDARMSQPWKLVGMSGTVVTTVDGQDTNLEYEFDGTNIYISTNEETESFAYEYKMAVKDNGEVFSEEFITDINNGDIVSQSSKTSFWFWGNDDKNKTSVNLDLTGILTSYPSYDIPRLAWNDMTLMVDYSDNYTELVSGTTTISDTFDIAAPFDSISITEVPFDEYQAGSESVLFELKFEVDLDVLNGVN